MTTVYDPPRLEPDEAAVAVEDARPSGPAAAVVLAAGLGCFALGLLTVLTVASLAALIGSLVTRAAPLR